MIKKEFYDMECGIGLNSSEGCSEKPEIRNPRIGQRGMSEIRKKRIPRFLSPAEERRKGAGKPRFAPLRDSRGNTFFLSTLHWWPLEARRGMYKYLWKKSCVSQPGDN
ncbi:MAG: hypothetical protein B6245_11070 [Desulfobacteraceae bacterium 4572_88]|nr:MAG: hypothetical protein B6245_11070 [Desulfobacteraceae bacterium 4572_88]